MKESPPALPAPHSEEGRHPIAVVAARTGLSADVLRVWERRYSAVQPARSPEGVRLYSDADVERLVWLRKATAAGRSIGQIANLPPADLIRLVDEDDAARAGQPVEDVAEPVESVITEALECMRALDATALDGVLRRAIALLGVTVFLDHVVVPLLHRIGDEWHAGRITPAHEHLASSVLQHVIVGTMRDLASLASEPTVVVATPSGERHALGAALIGAWAAAEGWHVIFLGADLPASDIAASALSSGARIVALSIVYVEDRKKLLSEVRALTAQLPGGVDVIAGGAGASAVAADLQKVGVLVGRSLNDLRGALRSRA